MSASRPHSDLHEQARHLAETWAGYGGEDLGAASPIIYAAVIVSRAYRDLVEQNESYREALEFIASRGVPSHLTPFGSTRSIAAFVLGKTDDPFYRDGEKLLAACREAASSPASDPLGLKAADADLAAGRARLASEVFAEIEAERDPASGVAHEKVGGRATGRSAEDPATPEPSPASEPRDG